MKIFALVSIALGFTAMMGVPAYTVAHQEPADKISCDEHLAHAVKTCKDTGLSEFACKEGGAYSFKCKEMPEMILTVDGEPRKLVITDADGRTLGYVSWQAGAFKDMKIILKQHKR